MHPAAVITATKLTSLCIARDRDPKPRIVPDVPSSTTNIPCRRRGIRIDSRPYTMGIADLFRPKYRHSDVRVRTEAVRALTADDAAILISIARTDRDIGVRRLAIE